MNTMFAVGGSTMTITSFLKLVEIQTKVASMIPFLIGSVYAVYRFGEFEWVHFALMFISLLFIDMATTAINNYYDFKRAKKTEGYGYETHNAIVRYKLSEVSVILVIAFLLVTAITMGIVLVIHAGILILFLGGVSFALGILYSFGPIPISRLPLGEAVSGFFMGFVLIFVSVYIHVGEGQLVDILFSERFQQLSIQINVLEVIYIFLLSVPIMFGIANIMLANNICDLDDDLENKRYTLPTYIGKDWALLLFRCLYYASYIDILFLLLLRVHPILIVLFLGTLIPVQRHITKFARRQSKEHTFALSVNNFMIMGVSLLLVLGIASIGHI
jgi:1,4-dihydroxy-2-naphthoate octaprenyltransferase